MSAEATLTIPAPSRGRQLLAVLRLEWRRQLQGMRLPMLLALAVLPVLLLGASLWVHERADGPLDLLTRREHFAVFYHAVEVRLALFFGCLLLAVGLIRSEIEQGSLHFSLLTPLPRWLLVVGKYLGALSLGWVAFGGATIASLAVVFAPDLRWLVTTQGIREAASYLAMTLLGTLAYTACFLAAGTLFKSPGLPVAFYFVWEWMQFLLPPVLKQLSVVHYLKELTPVPISEGPFALLADPAPAWLTVAKLLLYALVAVATATLVVSRMELKYSDK